MNIAEFSIKRPVTTTMIIVSMVVLGMITFFNLRTELMPNINAPYAMITSNWSGASPDDMETLVTKVIEGGLTSVEDINSISTTSSEGSARLFIEFKFGVDINKKINDLISAVSSIQNQLPDAITRAPNVRKMVSTNSNVMTIVLAGPDLLKLKSFADNVVTPRLEKISGVGNVDVAGSAKRRISIYLDPNKLETYGLSINELYGKLRSASLTYPAGTVTEGDKTYLVKFYGEIKSFEEVQNLVIKNIDGRTLYLKDVGDVKLDTVEKTSYSRTEGQENVSINIEKVDTGNAINIADDVRAQLKELESILPNGANFIVKNDTSLDIKNSLDNVKNSAYVGIILAALTIFVFLKDFRATMIVSIAIPVSIIATFGLFGAKGMTLNVISMMGLTLGIGMLVDNSVVVIDNVFRHLTQLHEDPMTASERGTSEVVIPIISSTATTVCVFLPVVIQNGFLKEMFKDMSYSITFSLLASIVVAVTFVPMMCSKTLKKRSLIHKDGKILNYTKQKYKKFLAYALEHRGIVVSSIIVLFFVVLVLGVKFTGGNLQPKSDDGKYSVVAGLPTGMDVAKAERISKILEDAVKANPNTKTYSTRVSADSASVSVDIGLKSERKNKKSVDEVVAEVRKSIKAIPDVQLNVRSGGGGGGGGRGGGRDFSLTLKSDNDIQLKYVTQLLEKKLGATTGFADITSSYLGGIPEARLTLDRKKLEYYGLSASDVGMSLSYQILGGSPFSVKTGSDELNVTLILNPEYRNSLDLLLDSRIKNSSGTILKLADVVTLITAEGASSITKEDKIKTATLSANLTNGLTLSTAQAAATKVIEEVGLPKSVTYSWGGDAKMMADVLKQALTALAAALFLVYFILAAQFESFMVPLIVMGSVPLSLTGVFIGLLVTGQNRDMMVYIGIIMLVGIVVNNAIILIDYIQRLLGEGVAIKDALTTAAETRLRPILMTTISTLFGMLPMAFGIGQGSEFYQGMAISVIFGLAFSTLLTLIFIPVLYSFYYNVNTKLKEKRRMKDELEEENMKKLRAEGHEI